MTTLACIGEPISWLRLESFVAGGPDPSVTTHVAACPACARCLDEIRTDLVALPPLVVAPRRRSRWTWLVPTLGVAAVAAIALLILAPWRPDAARVVRENVVAVKGVGEVIVDVVRERAGVIRDDIRTFAPGDRWKVIVTCPPAATAVFDVTVAEPGAANLDRPIVPAQLVCGNRVVIPGAFTITGDRTNRVCVTITSPEGRGRACLTLTPE